MQLVARHSKCDDSKGNSWTVKSHFDGENWKQKKFSEENAVESCAKRCNGLSSMFRLTRCQKGLCRCICEIDASPDGTCLLDDGVKRGIGARRHLLYKYVPKGFVKTLKSDKRIKLLPSEFTISTKITFESFLNILH